MADKKLVTLYSAKGAKVEVSDELGKKLKESGFSTSEPKPILGKA